MGALTVTEEITMSINHNLIPYLWIASETLCLCKVLHEEASAVCHSVCHSLETKALSEFCRADCLS